MMTTTVQVLKVEGVITIGAVSSGDNHITNVTKYDIPGGPKGNSRPIFDEFFKKGDYIMVEDGVGAPPFKPIKFGGSLSTFVRIESVDRVALTITLEEPAMSGTSKAIIRVNRCVVSGTAGASHKGYICWQKAIFSSIGELVRVP